MTHFFEITSAGDAQDIDAPDGVRLHWLIHADMYAASAQLIDAVQAWDWPDGIVQTCIAGESTVIKALRSYIVNVKNGEKRDCYISGYWKLGLIEDKHQQMKRAETAA